MIVFPAIDLRAGRVVRLRQGRADAETVYGDDPAQVVQRWQTEGAEWLHVVNLDGAFGEDIPANLAALSQILKAISIPVQFGGGLREIGGIEAAFKLGVSRVILGTVAIRNPSLVSEALKCYGKERIVVGIDARSGFVATHGWKETSEMSAIDLARQMAERGVVRAVYTDIARDGMLTGIDHQGTAELARATGLKVIASGGVGSLDDIRAVASLGKDGIEGVIVGQALYTGKVRLKEAINVCKTDSSVS